MGNSNDGAGFGQVHDYWVLGPLGCILAIIVATLLCLFCYGRYKGLYGCTAFWVWVIWDYVRFRAEGLGYMGLCSFLYES